MQKLSKMIVLAGLLTQPLLAQQWYEKMDVGPAWMNTYRDFFHGKRRTSAIKGLSVDLGENWRALFDTETLRLSGIYNGDIQWGGTPWTGRHGSIMTMGEKGAVLLTDATPGWADESGSFEDKREIKGHGDMPNGKFTGHYRHGRTIVLKYLVNGTEVLENLARNGESVTRSLKFGARKEALTMLIADENKAFTLADDDTSAKSKEGLRILAFDGVKLALDPENPNRLLAKIPKGEAELVARISMGKTDGLEVSEKPDFAKLTSGGPGIWNETLSTEGRIDTSNDKTYLTDVATLPDKNPWEANLRFGGFDFIDEDSAALSTWNGDVWTVTGLSSDWKELKWRRIAAGLFETLGVKVVDGEIYVNGRDQITKLIDLNDDGETDYFKVFNRDVYVSASFHEFAFDLQTDKEGNFYFAKAAPVRGGGRGFDEILPHHGIVAKISPDGKKFEVVATGLRAPGGIGIGPDGQITTGENEGTWQPACKINYVTAKDAPVFFGTEDTRQFLSSQPYTQPLVYLPMSVDNSGGSQVWVPDFAKFGLETGELIHLSYGKSSLFRVLPVVANGKIQGGVAKLPIGLQSSAMRARFHPDGSLYVLGFRGWQTNAATESAFQRIRFNGEVPLTVPEKLEYTETGVKLTFPVKLDPELAEDPTSYAAQRWDYVRGPQYGSGRFSVDNPDKEAMAKALTSESKGYNNIDTVKIESAKLSEDGRTVDLLLEGMKPSMTLSIKYDLEDMDGEILKDEIHATVYE